MEVKTLVSFAGDRFSWLSGQVVTVSEAEGQRMIADGLAIPVEPVRDSEPVPPKPKKSKRKKGSDVSDRPGENHEAS